MNTDTGEIHLMGGLESLMLARLAVDDAKRRGKLKPMKVAPTPQQMARRPPKIGLNEPCGCGSGRKFKKCCWTGGRNDEWP